MTATITTRERLIDAATELLHEFPYHAVGVQTLCEHAGVRKGSFYHFFGSKEELTIAAMDRAWQACRAEVETILSGPGTDDERLRAVVAAFLAANRGQTPTGATILGCPFARIAASISADEPALRLRLAEIFEEWANLLADATGGDRATAWSTLAEIQGRLLLRASTGRYLA